MDGEIICAAVAALHTTGTDGTNTLGAVQAVAVLLVTLGP